ncbi:MAG: malate synthase A, partial [Mameliella sp.]|nr:malate synthase A [Phaeodactylibacter sp.]
MNTMTIESFPTIDELAISGVFNPAFAEILTPEAQTFLLKLHQRFNERRLQLLEARKIKQLKIDGGQLPDFLPETRAIRESDWKVAPLPADLLDRRVEITGPVERKMVINALNSGAKTFMADFEDSNTPNWENTIQGQINLRDAIRGDITYEDIKRGKSYQLKEQTAVLLVRPRGWHLEEKHLVSEGQQLSGSLVDFGLYFFHNAKTLISKGSGPYFYLPKMESHLEARLWNDVFVFAQDYLGIPQRTIKTTVLIETILASFELHEILYELRDHSAGLNCGRWDYIFSYIKKLRNLEGYALPDRAQVTMSVGFMKAYAQLVIQTCHRRGVHAMGGMAAQIPIKGDEAANQAAIEKVRNDKLREAQDGHDGTWVAHPGLVPVAKAVFDEYMPQKNQINNKREDVAVTAEDLLSPPGGTITEEGLRLNINVGILYIESWLRGNGAAAIYHLMEDAATAEISRTQVWQWIHTKAALDDGRAVTFGLYLDLLPEELQKIKAYVGEERYEQGRFEEAVELFAH